MPLIGIPMYANFWSFSDYSVDCHLLLSGIRFDVSPLLDNGETARTFEDVKNLVWRIAYVLVKVCGYLSEVVYVHAARAQDSSSLSGMNKSVMKWKSESRIHKSLIFDPKLEP